MTKSSIKIEELNSFASTDLKAIQNLIAELGSSFTPLSSKFLKEIVDSSTTFLFVARYDGKIIGMATLAIYRIPYLKKAYLDDFIIDETYQGQGLGSKLIKTTIAKATEQGAKYIEFTSNPKRTKANKFYQKQGFTKRKTNVYRMNLTHE